MPAFMPTWLLISLRPRGDHESLRRLARRHDGGLIALSPWQLRQHDDAPARRALRAALACTRVVFTSPGAVRAARALQVFKPQRGQIYCAVGAGTAAALHRAGVAEVQAPSRMDSEGLLALPALQHLADATVGLVTAPGGRELIAAGLQARGAQVLRAEVYSREPIALSPRALQRIATNELPTVLALSSGEALQHVLAAAPPAVVARLRQARVVAASPRLVQLAREQGFADIVLASGPRPADLVGAALKGAALPASGSMA